MTVTITLGRDASSDWRSSKPRHSEAKSAEGPEPTMSRHDYIQARVQTAAKNARSPLDLGRRRPNTGIILPPRPPVPIETLSAKVVPCDNGPLDQRCPPTPKRLPPRESNASPALPKSAELGGRGEESICERTANRDEASASCGRQVEPVATDEAMRNGNGKRVRSTDDVANIPPRPKAPNCMEQGGGVKNGTPAVPIRRGGENETADVGSAEDLPHDLSGEQKHICDLVKSGVNVFFTGPAGSGKSLVLRTIIKSYEREIARHGPNILAVTATTNLAALLIGGTTLHHWAGVGLAEEDLMDLVAKIERNPETKARWVEARLLILDEGISRYSKHRVVTEQSVKVRRNQLPFGGIQLPPVDNDKRRRKAPYAFEADCWRECFPHGWKLTGIHRQKEAELLEMLQQVRFGTLSDKSKLLLNQLSQPVKWPKGVIPVELFTHVDLVMAANRRRLDDLPGDELKYQAVDKVDSPLLKKRRIEKLFDEATAPQLLHLKLNAKVILLRNIPGHPALVKGRFGYVRGFVTEKAWKARYQDIAWFSDEELASVPRSTKDEWGEELCPIVEFEPIGNFGTETVLVVPQDWTVEDTRHRRAGYRRQWTGLGDQTLPDNE
ncbi:hypothetical protein CALVIDRAFT_524669 [Calocera viscosa TUFC12733]|uniref:ATP-dependent DNA helicase n=1 Tax=Calocera viscosa (strain TUFC12733) TaxID=1330018 RepID=A0A167RJP0_CALVF|nr:hypothetical protein CALVIDRAFT_524669 [Calocera viscosa TUFC12733]